MSTREDIKSVYLNLPLHNAAQCYDHKTIKNILREGVDPNTTDSWLQTPLHVLLKNGFLGELNSEDMETCLKILIKSGANVNVCDKSLKTPLYYAITHTFPECTKILINHGADISKSSEICKSNYTLANQLALTMPEVMLGIFDNSVTQEIVGGQAKIRLDWRPVLQYLTFEWKGTAHKFYFKPGKKQWETTFLYSLLKGNHETRKKVLTHPLVSTFLYLKYGRVRKHLWSFHFVIALFPLLYMIFTYYLYFIQCGYKDIMKNSTEPSNNSFSPNSSYFIRESKCQIPWEISVSAYILTVIVGGWSAVEVYLLLRIDIQYLSSWRTWITIFTLVNMIMTLWPGLQFETLEITFQYPIAAIGIFFGFVMFLLQVGSHPDVSIYLEVLVKILLSVLKIILLFLPLLIGFYFGFRLMFENSDSVFRYIIMTVDVGSAEYEDLVMDTKEEYFWFRAMGYTFCVSFMIIIVIVFMNFVLGTSISDIRKLNYEAKISILSQQIQNLFAIDLVAGRFAGINCRVIKLEQLRNGVHYYEFSPNDSMCRIPKDIQIELIRIIKKSKYSEVEIFQKREVIGVNNNSIHVTPPTHIDYQVKYDLLLRKIVNLESKTNEMISKLDTLEL